MNREHLIPSTGIARFNGPAGRPLTIVAEVTPFLGHGHGSIAKDGLWTNGIEEDFG